MTAGWSRWIVLCGLAASVTAQQSDSMKVADSTRSDRYATLSVVDFARPESLDSLALVEVLTHDELMKFYHGDIADLLWNVTGVYVHDLGSYGKPISVSFNGLGNRNVLILVDGIPWSDPDVGWTNLNSLTLENIERIEIRRGGAVSRYGSRAAGGSVNIITRQIPADHAITHLKFRSVFSAFGDIGAFFGRPIGPHLQIRFGGSSKETPGEQNIQGFRGGFVRSIQRTRYTGNVLFGGLTYLAGEHWLIDAYRQSSHDRYDAYGRNLFGDSKNLDFTTPEGRRTDDRDEYRLKIVHRIGSWEQTLHTSHTQMAREARDFEDTLLAPRWQTSLTRVGYDAQVPVGTVRLQGGGVWNRVRSARLGGRWDSQELYARADWPIGFARMSGGIRLERHNAFGNGMAADGQVMVPLGQGRLWASTSYAVTMPDLTDRWLSGGVTGFSVGSEITPPHIASLTAGWDVRGSRIALVRVSAYVHDVRNGLYAEPIDYFSDSTRIRLRNARRGRPMGGDVEIAVRSGEFLWTVRQSLMKAPSELHQGTPTYMTLITARGDHDFLQKHLRMTGILQARWISRHDGYTYQDLPTVYMVAPRRSGGGWILNTRVTATIASFQLFYEAENILRARFTMLDGYDVTPQQVRVGLIWSLRD